MPVFKNLKNMLLFFKILKIVKLFLTKLVYMIGFITNNNILYNICVGLRVI